MYTKSKTISLADLESTYNAGKNLYIICGNDTVDQIEHLDTNLWYGHASFPSYNHQKAWRVPRTSANGPGDTLETIIQYMDNHNLDDAILKVSNSTTNVITDSDTGSEIKPDEVKTFNNWIEPDEDEIAEDD